MGGVEGECFALLHKRSIRVDPWCDFCSCSKEQGLNFGINLSRSKALLNGLIWNVSQKVENRIL